MPEIVEVRKYADFLNKYLHNNKIIDITIVKGRYKTHKPFKGYNKLIRLLPIKVIEVKTKGKFIYFILDNLVIFNTLGLSGGWLYSNNSNRFKHPLVHEFLNKNDVDEYRKASLNHLNIELKLEKGYLYYFDMLSYGTMKVATKEELEEKLNKLGPDLLDLNTTQDIFIERIIKKRNLDKEIGLVLMDQKIISGIGNYLRADSLWLAGISPFRYVKDLNNDELINIYNSVRSLVWSDYNFKLAVKLKIINKNFKTSQNYKRDFFIYYYEQDIFGNKIKKEKLYDRYIYWVPSVQK